MKFPDSSLDHPKITIFFELFDEGINKKKLIKKNRFTQLILLTICKYNYKKMSKHIVKGMLLFKVGDIIGNVLYIF